MEWLKTEPATVYHGYSFALTRQLGAAFELGAQYLQWLARHGVDGLDPTIAHCLEISAGAKALILKTARAVTAKRAVDFGPLLDGMAAHWDAALGDLAARYPA